MNFTYPLNHEYFIPNFVTDNSVINPGFFYV